MGDRVMAEFKPRREGDADYSAVMTSFVKSVSISHQSGHRGYEGYIARGPSMSQLNIFRSKYPMDDRAFEFLVNSPESIQEEAIHSFSPRNIADGDFSRP